LQMIYPELEQADIIVLASPIHFMGVTAQMKEMIDRCQALWARKYVLKVPPLGDRRERKGFFISVGGRRIPNLFEPTLVMIKSFFHILDVTYAGALLFTGIDEKGAIAKHPDALKQAYQAGEKVAAEMLAQKSVAPVSGVPPKIDRESVPQSGADSARP